MKIRSKPSAFYTIQVRQILTHWQLLLWLDLHCATAAIVSSPPILLKNFVFGEIDEFIVRTGQPTSWGEGVGQFRLLPLVCQLTAPHDISHLTFWHHGLSPKNRDI
ncbi:hypothetical protein [Pelagimonas varians]|uniref:Uncharacterized protein n=1 Tax=Pelagimonas varians TaxID=696760 RepID=A0A238JYQ9_9RHOB|nr:hypothetical protein [Pelagimonas varians]PYG33141.1 hypothetical protein C8N36_102136 [Pelagimonas varians]SMX35801.1 hypothetical protein PEV8663_00598 [Pelagimonas varians]